MSRDFFALLQIPQAILVEEKLIKAAWHRAAATGGNAEEINQAYAILKEPSLRIGHLLDLHAKDRESSAQPGASLFSLFFDVSTLLQKADESIAALLGVSSALQRAALIDPLLTLLAELETTADLVQSWQTRHLENLRAIDVSFPDLDDAQWQRLAEISCELVFLAKWKSEVRKRLTQMQEMLLGAMN